jgi:hypothetical protein
MVNGQVEHTKDRRGGSSSSWSLRGTGRVVAALVLSTGDVGSRFGVLCAVSICRDTTFINTDIVINIVPNAKYNIHISRYCRHFFFDIVYNIE